MEIGRGQGWGQGRDVTERWTRSGVPELGHRQAGHSCLCKNWMHQGWTGVQGLGICARVRCVKAGCGRARFGHATARQWCKECTGVQARNVLRSESITRSSSEPQRLHVQGLTSCARARMSCKGQKAVQGVRPGVRVPMTAHKHWCAKAGQGTQDKC